MTVHSIHFYSKIALYTYILSKRVNERKYLEIYYYHNNKNYNPDYLNYGTALVHT